MIQPDIFLNFPCHVAVHWLRITFGLPAFHSSAVLQRLETVNCLSRTELVTFLQTFLFSLLSQGTEHHHLHTAAQPRNLWAIRDISLFPPPPHLSPGPVNPASKMSVCVSLLPRLQPWFSPVCHLLNCSNLLLSYRDACLPLLPTQLTIHIVATDPSSPGIPALYPEPFSGSHLIWMCWKTPLEKENCGIKREWNPETKQERKKPHKTQWKT